MTRSTLPPLRRPVAETAPGAGRIFISYVHRDEEFVLRWRCTGKVRCAAVGSPREVDAVRHGHGSVQQATQRTQSVLSTN
ncbi:MAG: hypothetical protein KJZ93_22680 [Caldilineaceae bacterium]|nr:hypothetical protein [Caldilineaceae bacterium]